MDRSSDRRRFLRAAAGVGAAVAAAGCSAPLDVLRSEDPPEQPPGTIGDRDGAPLDDGTVAWPRERFDAANTRFNPDAALLEEPTARRLTDEGDSIHCPLVGDDRLYWYETSESALEMSLTGRDASGGEVWTRDVSGFSPCSIVAPDVVYAVGRESASNDRPVYGLSAYDAGTGDVLWRNDLAASNVAHDGDRLYAHRVYARDNVYAQRSELAAIDPTTGTVDWHLEFDGLQYSHTAIAVADDTVYAFDRNAAVAAVDATDGDVEWDRALDPKEELLGPIVATDERVLVAARRELVALEAATGDVAWRYADESYHSDPAIPTVAGDRVFLSPARPEPDLVCLDLETGDERWRREPEAEPAPEPPLAVGDGVYYALADGGLLAVTHEGEVQWRDEERAVESLHAAADRLYVTVSGEYDQDSLYALKG